jgi:hypothetical protein
MYANVKMIPEGERKENGGGGGGEFKYDIHCKNFCKYPNVPPSSTIKKIAILLRDK